MKKLSKLVSVMLSAVMCIGMATPALAVEYNILDGNVFVKNDENDGVYSYQAKADGETAHIYTKDDSDIVIVDYLRDEDDPDWVRYRQVTSNTISVGENVTNTTITLDGVNIKAKHEAAFSVGADSDVTVELKAINNLEGDTCYAGLQLNDGASVTIQDKIKSEPGDVTILYAYGKYGCPGIGGRNAGNITITDGAEVSAISGGGGAGIGSSSGGKVGDIKITNGAIVSAGRSSHAAAIGAGSYGTAGDITIEDSTVTALVPIIGGEVWDCFHGAAIGTGLKGTVGDITIAGNANITAVAAPAAAAIGSGMGGKAGTITIKDSATVKAECAGNGTAAIGSGKRCMDSSDGTITPASTGDIVIIGNIKLDAKGKGAVDIGPSAGSETETGTIDIRITNEDNTLRYVHQPKGGAWIEYLVTPPDGKQSVVNDDQGYTVDIPAGSTAMPKDGNEAMLLVHGAKISSDGAIVENGHTRGSEVQENYVEPTLTADGGYDMVVYCPVCNAELQRNHVTLTMSTPDVGDGDDDNGGGTTIPDADVPLAGDPGADTATIADQEVPLAALFTRADAIGYLWEQSGSPEAELSDFPDVPEDHRWAVAIGWAQDAGIALPDEDGNFRPDDLVLRASGEPEGELQEFLNRYAAYAGIELDEGELFIVLEGAADDIIMGADAQVIFDGFFAKLEAALQEKAA